MKKLTLKDIEKWQDDNSEDFLIDGPMSIASWNLIHDNLLARLKVHPILGEHLDQNAVYVEEMLLMPEDDFWVIEEASKYIMEELCKAVEETGADVHADIIAYG